MRSVFYISEQTGITTENLGNALLSKFGGRDFHIETCPFIDSETKIRKMLLTIKNKYLVSGIKPIVVTSIYEKRLRDLFKNDYMIHCDPFDAFMPILKAELGEVSPLQTNIHGINNEDKYKNRISAIDFAIYNDDGAVFENYHQADVILFGVSRVGKTPVCIYLAVNYGIKAANYPITDIDFSYNTLPKPIQQFYNKLFGLTIDPDRLHSIRTNRLPDSDYAKLETCEREVKTAEAIMQNSGVLYLNTSKKSVEEIAAAIMQKIKLVKKF